MKDVMTLKTLQEKWNKEKEYYKIKEIGDGVEAFIIDILKSVIFNLRQGLGSQENHNRINEFTLETSQKGEDKRTRRADVVVFINSNVVIPVEIEKFENIKAGEKQIIAYQKDWSKKYGILTDGFTWRFYNNTRYTTFTINDFFNKIDVFKNFWQEYIKEEKYYLDFFKPKKEGLLEGEVCLKASEDNDIFFKETTELMKRFVSNLNLGEFIKEEKKQIETAYSYLIQFILVKSLVDNGYEKFKEDYDNKIEKIIENIEKSNHSKTLALIRSLSSHIEKDIYKPFNEDQKFINERLQDILAKTDEEIGDISIWLDIVCYIHRFNFGSIKNDIFGSIYENYLKALYQDVNLGQFFTPPEIVDLMLEEIGWTKEEILKRVKENKDNLSIIDPSCGSGTFLYSATDILMEALKPEGNEEKSKQIEKLINDNIFGLDVEAFSLYLAEMNILMKLLPCIVNEKYNNPIDKKLKIFETKDSIAEFWSSYRVNKEIKKNQSDLPLFSEDYTQVDASLRDEVDLNETKESILDKINPQRKRFDFVIGNPPYISYNSCASDKTLTFEMIKGNIKDKDGNIIKIDLNDVYGINLHSTPENRKKYSPKPNLYAFFIALANGLLKDGGKMCYIIPQTLLTNTDYDVIRYHLAKEMTIEKIIIFSCKMFVDRGIKTKRDIATSSLIFVVKKAKSHENHKVKIINYINEEQRNIDKIIQDIKKDKNIDQKEILQTELLENINNWNYITQNKTFLKFYKFYNKNTEDLSCYYEHKRARERFNEEFIFDIGFILEKTLIKENQQKDDHFLLDFNDFKGFSCYNASKFYPSDRNFIKLPQNSQDYKLLNKEYKIIWSIKNPKQIYFTNKNILFYMGKACSISSNNKNESFYLFSILQSSINWLIYNKILKNKNEKELLLSIKSIKSFIRIPIITKKNQSIKDKVIEQTEKMLALENIKLSDLIDFKYKGMCPQTFKKVFIKDNFLICEDTNSNEIKFNIIDEKGINFVKKIIDAKNKDLFSTDLISLQSLKDLEAIDFDLRDRLKEYIDHLIFALYCNIELSGIEFSDFEEIKEKCREGEFYKKIFDK